jgi:hypothetical protein
LGGVQRQIAEHAKELVAIAGDLGVQRRTVRRQQRRRAVGRANGAIDVGEQVANREHGLSQRWRLLTQEVERSAGQSDRTVDRLVQPGNEPLHLRILNAGESIRDQHHAGERVA